MEKQSIKEIKELAKIGRESECRFVEGSTGIKYYLQYPDGLDFSEIILSQPKAIEQDKTNVLEMTPEDKMNRRSFYKTMTMFFVKKPKITEHNTEKSLGWNDVPVKDKTILENAIVQMMGITPEKLEEELEKIEIFRDNASGKSNKHSVSQDREASKRTILQAKSDSKNIIRPSPMA